MSKQKKSNKPNTYFNNKSKEQHKQDVKNAHKGTDYYLQKIGFLDRITLCDYWGKNQRVDRDF